jgi:hypothetical protein
MRQQNSSFLFIANRLYTLGKIRLNRWIYPTRLLEETATEVSFFELVIGASITFNADFGGGR